MKCDGMSFIKGEIVICAEKNDRFCSGGKKNARTIKNDVTKTDGRKNF